MPATDWWFYFLLPGLISSIPEVWGQLTPSTFHAQKKPQGWWHPWVPAKIWRMGSTDRNKSYLPFLFIRPSGSPIISPLLPNPSLPDSLENSPLLISPLLQGRGTCSWHCPSLFKGHQQKKFPKLLPTQVSIWGPPTCPLISVTESLACRLSLVWLITRTVVFRGNSLVLSFNAHDSAWMCGGRNSPSSLHGHSSY